MGCAFLAQLLAPIPTASATPVAAADGSLARRVAGQELALAVCGALSRSAALAQSAFFEPLLPALVLAGALPTCS